MLFKRNHFVRRKTNQQVTKLFVHSGRFNDCRVHFAATVNSINVEHFCSSNCLFVFKKKEKESLFSIRLCKQDDDYNTQDNASENENERKHQKTERKNEKTSIGNVYRRKCVCMYCSGKLPI